MTKDSSFTLTMTPIRAEANTILSILFELPGSGILTPEDVKALGRAIGPHIEQWLTSYARSRNFDLQLPVSLRIYAKNKTLEDQQRFDQQDQQELKRQLGGQRS